MALVLVGADCAEAARMKLAALILACLLTACGSGNCEWPAEVEKPTKVADPQ